MVHKEELLRDYQVPHTDGTQHEGLSKKTKLFTPSSIFYTAYLQSILEFLLKGQMSAFVGNNTVLFLGAPRIKLFMDDCAPGHKGACPTNFLKSMGCERIQVPAGCTPLTQAADRPNTNFRLKSILRSVMRTKLSVFLNIKHY